MTNAATLCIVFAACPLTVSPSRFPPQGKSSSGAPTLAPRFLLRTLPRVLTSRFLPQACAHFPTPPSALCPDQAIIERHRHLSVLISAATYVAVMRGRHDERGRSTSSVAEYTRARLREIHPMENTSSQVRATSLEGRPQRTPLRTGPERRSETRARRSLASDL
ncbi:hypothetical protein EV122DRAFT_265562, partial [Schizophyllum commune]